MKFLIYLFLLGASLAAIAQTLENSAPDVYRDFLIAVIKGDRVGAAKLALPNTDIAILFSSDVAPAEIQKEAIAHITANPYGILKVGEVFTLPNGRTVSPTEETEKMGWVIIANQTDPLPHMLQNVDGVWRADAGDLIAARKSAAKARK